MEAALFVAAVISQPTLPPTSKDLDIFPMPVLIFILALIPVLFVDDSSDSTKKVHIYFTIPPLLNECKIIDHFSPNIQVPCAL
jgi:hypothetical protein